MRRSRSESTIPTERRALVPAHRRLVGAWLLVAMCALSLTWVSTQRPVPVYDGINAPDEPYRYVSPPAGTKATAAPTRATASSPATGGLNTADLKAVSAEVGPQVQVAVPRLALQGPADQHTMTLEAAPVAPDQQPAVGTIDGNVYRITVTAGGQPATFRSEQSPGAIRIRATTDSQPGPVFVHRASATAIWTTLETSRVGNDIYQTSLVGSGDYALAFRPADVPQTTPKSSSGGISPAVLVVIGLLVVSVVVGAVLATRRRGQP